MEDLLLDNYVPGLLVLGGICISVHTELILRLLILSLQNGYGSWPNKVWENNCPSMRCFIDWF